MEKEFERIMTTITNNTKESQDIQKVLNKEEDIEEYKGMSEEALQERQKFLADQNKSLNNYLNSAKQAVENIEKLKKDQEEAKKEKNNGKVKEIGTKIANEQKKISDGRKSIANNTQGKTKEVISSLFGQIDKRVHNVLYGSETKANWFQNGAWAAHSWWVNFRYNHPAGYVGGSMLATLGIVAVASIFAAPVSTLLIASPYVAIWGTKLGSTIFNLLKYGDMPKLERHKDIKKGTIKDCLNNALFERKKAKETMKLLKGSKRKDGKKVDKADKASSLTPNQQKFKDSKEKFDKINVKSLKLEDLTDEKVKELEEIIEGLQLFPDKLNDDEKTACRTISDLTSDYKKKKSKKPDTDTIVDLNLKGLPKERVERIKNYIKGKKLTDEQILDIIRSELNDYKLEREKRLAKIEDAKKRLRDLRIAFIESKGKSLDTKEYRDVLMTLKDVVSELNDEETNDYNALTNAFMFEADEPRKKLIEMIDALDIDNLDSLNVMRCMAYINSFAAYARNNILKGISPEKLDKLNACVGKLNLGDLVDIDDLLKKIDKLADVASILKQEKYFTDLEDSEIEILKDNLPLIKKVQMFDDVYQTMSLGSSIPNRVIDKEKYNTLMSLNKEQVNLYNEYLDTLKGKTK